jgi:hypothetical protein
VFIKLLIDYSAHKSFVSMPPDLQYKIQINVIYFSLVYAIEIIKHKKYIIVLFLCFISHIMDKEIYMFIYTKFQVCTSNAFNTKSKCTVIYKAPSQSRVLKPNLESNYSHKPNSYDMLQNHIKPSAESSHKS